MGGTRAAANVTMHRFNNSPALNCLIADFDGTFKFALTMKHSFSLLVLGTAVLLAGCSDPADSVSKASTSSTTNTATAVVNAQEYIIQPDSKIDFIGSKVTGKHDGGFKTFDGNVSVAEGKVVGATVKIDMQSTWSDNEKLTGHLKSPDFFDVEKFPTSTFTVTKVEGTGDTATVIGNLELHGVTKAISFPAKVHLGDDALHVTADFAINRKEFGIVYPGKTDDLIRDDVVIRFDLKAAPKKA
jgi:polyisoprenoid-binding protein YceI